MAIMNGQTSKLIGDIQSNDDEKRKAAIEHLVRAGILKPEKKEN